MKTLRRRPTAAREIRVKKGRSDLLVRYSIRSMNMYSIS